MSDDISHMDSVQKKLEQLDTELGEFSQVVSEVKEMRNSAADLHGRLKEHEDEIINQKMELEQLMSSTGNMMLSFEEKTRGVLFDLEKKTDDLMGEVKSGISLIGTLCEQGDNNLKDQQMENPGAISKKYQDIKVVCDTLKTMADEQDKKINKLENGYAAASSVYEKLGSSVADMKKTIYELQKKPYDIDNKIKKLEERLETSIDLKFSRQKTFIVTMMVALIVGVLLFISALYLR